MYSFELIGKKFESRGKEEVVLRVEVLGVGKVVKWKDLFYEEVCLFV